MSVGELACTYACLLLHDDGISITTDKIFAVVSMAGIEVESYWPGLFAKLVQKRSVEGLISNVGSKGGIAVVVSAFVAGGGGGSAAAAAAPVVEEKKEEPKEESDDDMGFSLFD